MFRTLEKTLSIVCMVVWLSLLGGQSAELYTTVRRISFCTAKVESVVTQKEHFLSEAYPVQNVVGRV